MIGIVFLYAGEFVEVRIDDVNILFRTSQSINNFSPIEGLKLSREGVLKEFPELEGRLDWREEAINRFKEHIRQLKTEEARAKYIIEDLAKHGYLPKYKQKKGFRVELIKWHG